jgi:hypothetical protein
VQALHHRERSSSGIKSRHSIVALLALMHLEARITLTFLVTSFGAGLPPRQCETGDRGRLPIRWWDQIEPPFSGPPDGPPALLYSATNLTDNQLEQFTVMARLRGRDAQRGRQAGAPTLDAGK